MSRNKKDISQRKRDHLKIALSDESQIGNTGFDRYRFIHNALPEIDFDKIDTSTAFLGKKVNYPFFISCMTGGVKDGARLNKNLAKVAQKHGIAMGVGSQRIMIENPRLKKLFEVRKYALDIPVIANIGLVQLNYGFGIKECEEMVAMVNADALALHINPIQEAIQPEGNHNFENLLGKLEKVVKKLSVPVIVKEVGFGLSEDVIKRLYNVGVRIFDTAGWGGTNWAFVEAERHSPSEALAKGNIEVGKLFTNWGIPTTNSILAAKIVKDKNKDKRMVILGSGGIRTGIDIAKAIGLGSDLAGIAAPFAKAALKSSTAVEDLIERLGMELKIAMFGVGAKDISQLKSKKLIQV
jgi:isopentenyl-diphosphate delta-isomerase